MKKITLFMAVALFCSAQLFSQTTYTVNAITGTDSGTSWKTIKGAIAAASATAGDIINVAAGTYTEKGILVNKPLTIRGAGMGLTIVQPVGTWTSNSNGVAIDLNATYTTSPTINLEDMTIQYAWNSGSGGGIRLDNKGNGVPTVNLKNLKISSNNASNGGGVFCQGPAILNVLGCNIIGNTATGASGNGGAGICVVATGGPTNLTTPLPGTSDINVSIKKSTISNNTVVGTYGGGIAVNCAAAPNRAVNHSILIENSTIYGNKTQLAAGSLGGGIYLKCVTANPGFTVTQAMTLNHCTISGNTTTASTGGDGVCVENGNLYNTTLVMNNSIVMGNSTTGGSTPSQVGTSAGGSKITDGGISNSIFGIIASGAWVTSTNNNTVPTPSSVAPAPVMATILTNLALAGSLTSDATPVLLIGPTSIARNYVTGTNNVTSLNTDQIGHSRSGVTDAGAYEYQAVTYTIGATAGTGGVVTSGTGTYDNGTPITLVATPASGYGFLNWTEGGTVVSTAASYAFTVSANRTLVANFVTHSLISASAADANGIVLAASTYVNDGASFTLTATPNSGYSFLNWTEGSSEVSTSAAYTFTVSATRTLVANFAPTATINLNGGTTYTTIADAIAASGSASDIINISAGIVTEKVITLTKSLTIKGAGMGNTFVQAAATPASGTGIAFTLDATYTIATTITLEDMTIRNGYNNGSAGGVRLNNAGTTVSPTLNLVNLKIYNNRGGNGGGVWVQGPATLNVTGCNITANTATNATAAAGGGGISVVAIGASAVNATIKNSTISNNTVAATSANNGGGISVQCGLNAGVAVDHKLWIENSTIYGNSTGYAGKVGGGICFKTTNAAQATTPTQTVTLNHCTIANNTTNAGTGADGICFDAAGGYPTSLVMNNSIVMGNGGSTSNASQVGTNNADQSKITNGGIANNILGISGTWVSAATTNNNITAVVGDLAFVGSLSTDATPVLKIGSGSIARSYVTSNLLSPAIATDQLGTTRLGNFDAGAWEYPIKRYVIAASAGTGGSITSGAGNYDSGATATVLAAATAGYRFVNWTVNGLEVATTASYGFTVSANKTLVANFGISTVSVSETARTGFTYIYGAGASTEQTFTVGGSHLNGNITLTPPTNYEISTATGVSFVATNPITLTQTSGSVGTTTIYVRLKAGLAVNTYNTENIAIASTEVSAQDVVCSGSVTAKELTISGISGTSKTYDGNTTATLTGTAALVGVISADDVTLGGTYIANFSQSAVGTSLPITVTGYSISGTASVNYTLSQPSGLTADINSAGPSAPTATAATGKTSFSFSANWNAVSGATGYKLDVATDAGFTSYLSGYTDLTVSGTTKIVGSLTANTTYYYRVRATNADGTSANSNTISIGTLATFIVSTPTVITTDTYSNTAITVSGSSQLTINQAITVPKIVVESSSQLVVNSPLIVDSLTFKAGITGTFSALLDNGITANKVRFLKTLNPSKWFFMSFPCNVDIAKIKRTDGAALIYNDDIFIKYYDGSNRSNGNYGANWLMMASNGTLLANHGYIIGLKDGLGDVELEFPLEPTLVATAESQRTVQVDGNQGTSLKTTDKGWNLVGQPYLSKFTGGNASNVNYMLFSDGGTTYTTYSKLVGGLPVIDPFAAYFIQVGEDANLPYIFGGGRQLAPSLVTTNFSDIVQINVTTATGTDNTNLIMDNDQSTAYQIGLDMEKWIGTGTAKPQVYTILGGINYSFNALPMSSVSNLLIGIYTQVAGSTTISVDATQSASLSKLLLTDNGVSPATITDLLTSNYSFTANAGTNNTRFAITAQRITTENNLIGNELDELGISMINDGLVLANLSPSTTVRVYDALGRLVVSKTANSNVMEIKLNAKGIYTIQLQSGTKSWTRKVVM